MSVCMADAEVFSAGSRSVIGMPLIFWTIALISSRWCRTRV